MDLLGLLGKGGLVLVAAVLFVWLVYVIVFKAFSMVVKHNTLVLIERWGKHNRIGRPGLNFMVPFADKPHARVFSKTQSVLPFEVVGTAGGTLPLHVSVALTIVDMLDETRIVRLAYEISDPRKLLEQRAKAIMMELLLPFTFEDVMNIGKRNDLLRSLRERLAPAAEECGYDILDLRIIDVSHDPQIRRAQLADEEAKVKRTTEAADANHKNSLLAAEASAKTAAAAIEVTAANARLGNQAEQLKGAADQLIASGLDQTATASVLAALVYQQTAAMLAGSTAQVILPPANLDLGRLPTGSLQQQ